MRAGTARRGAGIIKHGPQRSGIIKRSRHNEHTGGKPMTTDNLIPLAELVADGWGASVPGAPIVHHVAAQFGGAKSCEDHGRQRICQRW
jgi:hypothetical protein